MKFKKILFVSLVLLCVTTLSSCYKKDRYKIPSGNFEYTGEMVHFYDDLYIEELTITFTEISEDTFLESNNINVIKNYYDSTYFSVDLLFRYSIEDEAKKYSFEYIGKEFDRNDTYNIILNIDNEDIGINGSLNITILFLSEIGGTSDIGSYAKRASLYIRTTEINGLENDEKFNSFPKEINFVDKKS
jgi:hypothetical protein